MCNLNCSMNTHQQHKNTRKKKRNKKQIKTRTSSPSSTNSQPSNSSSSSSCSACGHQVWFSLGVFNGFVRRFFRGTQLLYLSVFLWNTTLEICRLRWLYRVMQEDTCTVGCNAVYKSDIVRSSIFFPEKKPNEERCDIRLTGAETHHFPRNNTNTQNKSLSKDDQFNARF